MNSIVTANALRSGQVVYLTRSRTWSPSIDDAARAASDDQAEEMLAFARKAVQVNDVIDPVAIPLIGADAAPARLRERIRAEGPTVQTFQARPDLPDAA